MLNQRHVLPEVLHVNTKNESVVIIGQQPTLVSSENIVIDQSKPNTHVESRSRSNMDLSNAIPPRDVVLSKGMLPRVLEHSLDRWISGPKTRGREKMRGLLRKGGNKKEENGQQHSMKVNVLSDAAFHYFGLANLTLLGSAVVIFCAQWAIASSLWCGNCFPLVGEY